MSAKLDLAEFVAGFLAEADDLLALASSSLLAAEKASRAGNASPRAVREGFRALHTIKGLSAMVGVEPIVALSHRMEALLRVADQGASRLTTESIDLLLQGVRAIEQRVSALRDGKPVPDAPPALLHRLEAIEGTAEGGARAAAAQLDLDLEPALLAKLSAPDREQLFLGLAAGKHALRADFVPSPEKAAAGLTITSVRERLAAHAEVVKVLPVSVPPSPEAPGGLSFSLLLLANQGADAIAAVFPPGALNARALASAPLPPPPEEKDLEEGGAARLGIVRVEISRLEDTIERLSALIVTRFRLSAEVARLAARGVDVRQLAQIVAENQRQLRDLRAAVLQVRMVRVADVLERVPLLVRGLRRNTGKLVRLELNTGEAEVDKAVGDRLFPAIVHLVRNAVDHAIESPEERKALGKPEEGVLRISCAQRGSNQLELVVEDDGRGVDRARVAARAKQPLPETDAALLELLCLPGLSTREEANVTSGRGMGMDIVRQIAVRELGGDLTMATTPGRGSAFTLRVPLTITIIDAFVFECAGERFVVPVSLVEEIIEIDGSTVRRAPGARARAALVERRGAALPVVQLAGILGLQGPSVGLKAFVVRRAGEATGVAVDRTLGQQEVVVRPLEDPLVRVPGVAGATDLGDGRPTLVLDLATLAGTVLSLEVAA